MGEGGCERRCDLCGLGVGRHPFERRCGGEDRAFCCLGCANVYAILLESGVLASGQDIRETDVFKRSLALGVISNGGDAPRGKQRVEIPKEAPRRETLLHVSGMWCSSCAWLIEQSLGSEPGVESVEAFFASDLVKVRYSPQFVPPERIAERIGDLGYRASEYTGEGDGPSAEKRDLLLRFGVAGFLWLNVMTLSTALYVGYFEDISSSVRRFLPALLMALATPVVVYSAKPILALAWRGAVNRTVRMETLLGLGILAAYVYSVVQVFAGADHVYFDTVSAIVALVLAGKLIEQDAKERTTRAISTLYRMAPRKARVLVDGSERFVTIDALGVGDVFLVKAGERIPADGVVVEGVSHADESMLTGESTPVAKRPGSVVVGGSLNTDSVLGVRATRVGDDTAIAGIIRLVERALGSKTSIERTVDRISRAFVPGVIALAVATFFGWWAVGSVDVGVALMRAITVLVIACPCALGMATPLAMTAAVGWASHRGILVGDSRVLETIRTVDVVVFDKTGTVTEGDFALVGARMLGAAAMLKTLDRRPDAESMGIALPSLLPNAALEYVAAVERYSEHPLGRAVVRHATERGIALPDARDVEIHKGYGATGTVAGCRVFVGNRILAESEGGAVDPDLVDEAANFEREGCTVVYFGWGGRPRGMLAFGDRPKPDARDAIAELARRGVKTMIVSGDALATTRYVARHLGVDDFQAEALPDDKTRAISDLQAEGAVVAMVGDGINDAPALAQADLGIALGSGADVAMHAAALVLTGGGLARVPETFDLARRTWSIVRQNLFWAFLYNTLGISLAVTGLLNPILAASAMLASSLSVILNSLRLGRPANG